MRNMMWENMTIQNMHTCADDKEHDQSSGVEQEEGEEIGDGEVDQTENPSAEEELNEEVHMYTNVCTHVQGIIMMGGNVLCGR